MQPVDCWKFEHFASGLRSLASQKLISWGILADQIQMHEIAAVRAKSHYQSGQMQEEHCAEKDPGGSNLPQSESKNQTYGPECKHQVIS